MIEVGVDPVVDDVHAIRGDVEQPQHVHPCLLADGDDRVGRLERRPLDPAAHVVSATELLPLPRAQRLQGMHGDHEGDAVGEAREQSGEVRVPGVRVDDVGLDRIGDHREIARERGEHRPQALVGLRQVVGGRIALDAPTGLGIGPCAERTNVELDQRSKVSRELVDVDAGAAVDRGWELVGQDQGAHAPSLACLPARSDRIRTAADRPQRETPRPGQRRMASRRPAPMRRSRPAASDARPCTPGSGRRPCDRLRGARGQGRRRGHPEGRRPG